MKSEQTEDLCRRTRTFSVTMDEMEILGFLNPKHLSILVTNQIAAMLSEKIVQMAEGELIDAVRNTITEAVNATVEQLTERITEIKATLACGDTGGNNTPPIANGSQ